MTNWFEQYYQELIEYAGKVVNNKKLTVDPIDLVNDAYIVFYESGVTFDLQDAKKYISTGGFKELKHELGKVNFGDKFYQKPYSAKGDKSCKCCNDVKPVNAFRLYKFDGFNFVSNFCFDCERAKTSARFKEWLKDPENRARWNAYVNNWKKKKGLIKSNRAERSKLKKPIHELWKKANKKYQEKQKEQLTDVYVRGILKASKKDFSPQAIAAKREELLQKRRQANVSSRTKK